MIIADISHRLNRKHPGENKRKIMYRMIERWRRKLEAVAMMMRLAYMMCTGIGAYNILCMFMFAKFMQ